MSERILRPAETSAKVGYSHPHIKRLVKSGQFPKPVRVGARAKGWIESELDQWISDRIALRDGGRA